MWCVVKCLLRFSVQIKSSFICLNVSFWLAKHLTLLSSICVVTACPNLHLPGINGQKLFFLGKKNPLFLAEKKLSWFLGQFLVKHTVVVIKSLVAKKQSVLYLFLCLPKKTMALLLLLKLKSNLQERWCWHFAVWQIASSLELFFPSFLRRVGPRTFYYVISDSICQVSHFLWLFKTRMSSVQFGTWLLTLLWLSRAYLGSSLFSTYLMTSDALQCMRTLEPIKNNSKIEL